MIKRPLLGLVVSLIIGILLHEVKLEYFIVVCVFLGMILNFAVCIPSIPIVKHISFRLNVRKFTKEDWHRFLWPVFLLVGFIRMNQVMTVSDVELALQAKSAGSLYGEVIDIKQKNDTTSILIDHATISLSQTERDIVAGKVIVYLSKECNLALGYQVNLTGEFSPLAKATNPGQFDEYDYYKAKNITCKMYANTMNITKAKRAIIADSFYQLKLLLTNQIQLLLPMKEAGLMNGILFGDKTLLSDEIGELYRENGLSHIMAVSGLHISLLGYGLYRFLKKLTAPKGIAVMLPIIILLGYGAIVGFSVSATRAIAMFILLMVASCIGRTYDMISALSLSAIVLLLNSPLQLFQPGFLLSFAAVLGICVVFPNLCEAFINEESKHKNMKKAILLSASIQLSTLPLVCYFYYEISIYSIVINMIVLPLCSFIVLTSLLSCLLSLIFVPLGQFCMGGTYYLLQFFSWLLRIPEHLPYHLILIGKLSITNIIAYYTVLSAILYWYWKRKQCFGWCFLTLLLLFLRVNQPKGISVTYLDVSQGDGSVLLWEGNVVMIDGGSTDVSLIYEYRIKPYFKSMGIRHIHTVFISHADKDHISGILECLRSMPKLDDLGAVSMKNYQGEITIGQLVLTKYAIHDENMLPLIQAAKEKQVELYYMEAGEMYEFEGMTFTCLHPGADFGSADRNSNSMVLLASYKEFDGLFTGDIDCIAEEAICETYEGLLRSRSIEVLKVAHHGSKNSSSLLFLEIVSPEIAVISSGKNNRYGHPHQDTLNRLMEIGSKVYCTKQEGAVTTE